MAQDDRQREDALFVASLGRGIRILEAFDQSPRSLGLAELTELTGMNRSAVQRFLHTWEQLGYLAKDPATRRFALTPRVLALGYKLPEGQPPGGGRHALPAGGPHAHGQFGLHGRALRHRGHLPRASAPAFSAVREHAARAAHPGLLRGAGHPFAPARSRGGRHPGPLGPRAHHPAHRDRPRAQPRAHPAHPRTGLLHFGPGVPDGRDRRIHAGGGRPGQAPGRRVHQRQVRRVGRGARGARAGAHRPGNGRAIGAQF